MNLKWTRKALADLERLYEFLAKTDPPAAARTIQALVEAPSLLLAHPRAGLRLSQFEPREVRRILVGQYEIRYEIANEGIYLLRIWHSREDR